MALTGRTHDGMRCHEAAKAGNTTFSTVTCPIAPWGENKFAGLMSRGMIQKPRDD